jgi:ABC-2 type transport system permease protein
MKAASRRIWGLIYRHIALYRGSWPRLLEIAYWPTLQMLVWGFTASFIGAHHGNLAATLAGSLIGGVLLWEVTLRGQMGVTLSFLEEIWSRNLGHIFVSPLRPAEMVAGLLGVSLLRTVIGVFPAMLIAWALYGFDIFALGPAFVLLFFNLTLMGWWLALLIVSLLFRYGAGAEALAWTVAFGLTPVACVFYPVSALPGVVQPVALAFPAAHIFEGMRATLAGHAWSWDHFVLATCLNFAWMLLAIAVFAGQFRAARVRGALIAIGE